MNIVVNTQLLIKDKLDGIGWFTYETLKRITRNHPEHTFYFVFDRPNHEDFVFSKNVKPIVLYPHSRHPFLWFIRYELLLPFILRKYKADVFLSPDGWMTLNTKVPGIQVIHDLNFEHYPQDLPYWTQKYYKTFFPKYARKATRIATVSQYSKNDIIQKYGILPEKIDVTQNGCNNVFKPLADEQKIEVREKYSAGAPYFLYVGALIPRKNVARLFRAFDMFKKQDKNNTKLLLAGQKMWLSNNVDKDFQNLQCKDDIIFLGRKKVKELTKLYSSSIALTYVSYFEGFGIPVLEAFNAETAVITSNCTSMPEVAGDAALLIDPFSVESIADAMIKVSNDKTLRQKLINKGKERRKHFSWDLTAERLWSCVEKVLKKNG